MDEAVIVQRLVQKLPKAPPPPADNRPQSELDVVAPVVTEAMGTATKDIAGGPNALGAMRLVEHFDVPGELVRDRTTLEKLAYIYDTLALREGSQEPTDVLLGLNQLEAMLGLTFREDKLEAIWRWLKLDEDRRRIDKEQSLV